jgi:hypothetical protein
MFLMLTLKHPSQQASTSCSPETEVAMEEMTQRRKMNRLILGNLVRRKILTN